MRKRLQAGDFPVLEDGVFDAATVLRLHHAG